MASFLSGNDKPPAELATLLANEVSAAVSKELETRMQQHTSQVEERVKAMLERFHSVTLQEIASIVAIAVQPPHHGHHQPPHHGATPFSHHPAHAMQPIKFQPQQLFAKAKESPPGSGPRPSDDSPPRPSSNRAAFDAAFAEEDEEELLAIREEEKKQEEAHKKDVKRREQFMEKFSADEIYGTSSDQPGSRKMTVSRGPGSSLLSDDSKFGQLGNFLNWLMPRLLIQPGADFRLWWDFVSMLLVIYIAATLPYRIAFLHDWSMAFAVFDFFIDLFFLLDVVLNFFTCYMHDGELINSYSKIARHYARTWLGPDLLSSIPFDWFANQNLFEPPPIDTNTDLGALTLLRVLKVIRLLRLLRVARLYRYAVRWEGYFAFFNSNILRLIKVVCIMFFFAHWNGCFQYLLATFEADITVVPSEANPGYNATEFQFQPNSLYARMIADGSLDDSNAWSWSFFIAINHMLAIGIGINNPMRTIELWGYLISMLCGMCLYGFFLASLTTAITEADASAKHYRTKLDMVNQYMRHSRLPKELRGKLRTYFELCFPSKRSFDEVGILSEISPPLRQEICLHKCRAVLSTLQVLNSAEGGLAGAISQELERVVYVSGDHIIREGEEPEGMYFVSQGQVEVVAASGDILSVLGPSSFFGEMALLNPDGRAVASIRVRSYCEGYRLSRDAYEKLVFSYPSFHEYLESVAKLRLRAKQVHNQKGIKDAELDTMFESLNPTKRKLIAKEIKAKKKSDEVVAMRNTAKRIMERESCKDGKGGAEEGSASLNSSVVVGVGAGPGTVLFHPDTKDGTKDGDEGGGGGTGTNNRTSKRWNGAEDGAGSRVSRRMPFGGGSKGGGGGGGGAFGPGPPSSQLDKITEAEQRVLDRVGDMALQNLVQSPPPGSPAAAAAAVRSSIRQQQQQQQQAVQAAQAAGRPPQQAWGGLGTFEA